MRKSLSSLIAKTFTLKFQLPNTNPAIPQTKFSTSKDSCYEAGKDIDIAEIIYNAIIDYSFNEYELKAADLNTMHARALLTKLRYDPKQNAKAQLKYGFFGEVLLYCILQKLHQAPPLIARGHFYNPTERAENKGYDAYHLTEDSKTCKLWLGEVKFHQSYQSCFKDIVTKLPITLSASYLNTNMLALQSRRQNMGLRSSRIEEILNAWERNPTINISAEVRKHKIDLAYPAVTIFDEKQKGFEATIQDAISYVNNLPSPLSKGRPLNFEIFFILIPVTGTKLIKKQVLEWIKSKKPLKS